MSTPDLDGFFSEKDAIAIPGFGASAGEVDHLIAVESGGVRIRTTGTVAFEAEDVTFKAIGTDDTPTSIV